MVIPANDDGCSWELGTPFILVENVMLVLIILQRYLAAHDYLVPLS